MSLIDVQNLTFAHEGSYDNVFEDATFRLDTDWRLGLCGRNGKGKTTLLHLLERGDSHITASVSFAYFPYAVPDESMTARELTETLCDGWQQWELEREMTQLEVADELLERPFCSLSNGEQTKLLLAALFLRSNSFLLIDEPTNHLDVRGRQLLSRYLRTKSGFILVSHDRAFLDGCVDHIMAINRRGIEICKGNFSTWYGNKQQRDAAELAENEQLRVEIKRLNKAARRTAEWSSSLERSKIGSHSADRGYIGHKSAKLMQRAKNLEKRKQTAAEEKSSLLHNIETAEKLHLRPLEYHGKRLAVARELAVRYGERTVCEGVSFELERGDRLALCGRNGSGKTSLLRLLTGRSAPCYDGFLQLGSGLLISYLPQDVGFLQGTLDGHAEAYGLDVPLFRAILRKLDFSRVQFEKPLSAYSEGQKKKVMLATSLATSAHLYIWDEPLNYIDVFSRIQVEQLLADCRATVVLVEHDTAFLDAVATKRVELKLQRDR